MFGGREIMFNTHFHQMESESSDMMHVDYSELNTNVASYKEPQIQSKI